MSGRRKFEEIYPPTVKEFVYITDDTYKDTQLKRMEHVMLKMLAFDMSAPTSNWFLNYFIDNGGAGEETAKHLAQVSRPFPADRPHGVLSRHRLGALPAPALGFERSALTCRRCGSRFAVHTCAHNAA